MPRWTYLHGGKLAVIATCSERRDLRVVSSTMLPHPVVLRKGGNLLIKIGNKTNPGKYVITLWCANSHHLIDALDVKQVKIYKRFGRFNCSRRRPACREHFKANVTITAGPPAPARNARGKKKQPLSRKGPPCRLRPADGRQSVPPAPRPRAAGEDVRG